MDIPFKGKNTKQVNLKIDDEISADIEFLRQHGVKIGEVLRPHVRQALKAVRQKLEKAS